MTRREADDAWTTCLKTGKRCYLDRRAARKARRQTPNGGAPMSLYRCADCAQWHIGHLPADLRRGETDRDRYRASKRRDTPAAD